MHGIGGVPLVSMGGAVHGGYFAKVLATGPIAYWPLWEASGTTARCLVNPAQNGTYSSDVSTWPVGTGMGDGNTAPQLDGANDSVNVLTAALIAAFNGSEGTLFQWIKVANAGVWTDLTRRDPFFVQVDGNNFCMMQKVSWANNRLGWYYTAGAVAESVTTGGLFSTDWVPIALTWSKAADEMKAYWAGAQSGVTQTILGNWAGNVGAAVLGATSAAPVNPWQGGLAHCAVWSRALSLTEYQALSIV